MDAIEKQAEDEEEDEGSSSSHLFCHIPSLDTYDPGSLEDPRDQLNDGVIGDIIDGIGVFGDFKWPFNEIRWASEWTEDNSLEKRGTGGARSFSPRCPDGSIINLKSQPYTNGDKGEALAKQNNDDKMYYVKDGTGDCISASVEDDGKPNDGKKWVCE
jgi:hypothetical protein